MCSNTFSWKFIVESKWHLSVCTLCLALAMRCSFRVHTYSTDAREVQVTQMKWWVLLHSLQWTLCVGWAYHPCLALLMQSCGFRVTDYLCLFLMILELVLLALVLFQVSGYDECISVPANTLLSEYPPCSLVAVHSPALSCIHLVQVASVVLSVIHMRKLQHESDNRVHPLSWWHAATGKMTWVVSILLHECPYLVYIPTYVCTLDSTFIMRCLLLCTRTPFPYLSADLFFMHC